MSNETFNDLIKLLKEFPDKPWAWDILSYNPNITWDTIKDSNLINKNHKNENFSESLLTNFHSFLISTLTLTILLFVLKPSIILNITQLLSLSLYNF